MRLVLQWPLTGVDMAGAECLVRVLAAAACVDCLLVTDASAHLCCAGCDIDVLPADDGVDGRFHTEEAKGLNDSDADCCTGSNHLLCTGPSPATQSRRFGI